MALPVSRSADEAVTASGPGGQGAAAYEREMEERVREILRGVSGVGEVDVMIVLKSSAEKVIQVDNRKGKRYRPGGGEPGAGTQHGADGKRERTGAGGSERSLPGDRWYRHQCLRGRQSIRAGRDFRGHGGIIRASGE